MSYKIHSILENSFENYHNKYSVPWPVRRVVLRTLRCRTEKMGGYRWECKCGNEKIVYRSCKSRSCSLCGPHELKKFVDKKVKKVFPGEHFHIVFTIPSELNKLWLSNTKLMGNILFSTARKTISKFTSDPKYLGAKPGIMMALHTWGQTLALHPHVHALVTSGGVDKKGKILFSKQKYLFSAKAAMKYFRYHFLKSIRSHPDFFEDIGDLKEIIETCFTKEWNIFVKEKYPVGKGVFLYLSKYVKGMPIGDSRIKSYNENSVTFSYTDYRDGKKKFMKLSTNDFLQRLLLHIPPKNFRTFREVGLYFSNNIEKLISRNHPRLFSAKHDLKLKVRSQIYASETCSSCKKEFDYMFIIDILLSGARGSPKRVVRYSL